MYVAGRPTGRPVYASVTKVYYVADWPSMKPGPAGGCIQPDFITVGSRVLRVDDKTLFLAPSDLKPAGGAVMTSRLNYAPAGKPTIMKRRGFAKFVAHPPNPKKKKMLHSGENEFSLNQEDPIGFIGLGLMGQRMARNLQHSGFKLVVWNRTSDKCRELIQGLRRKTISIHFSQFNFWTLTPYQQQEHCLQVPLETLLKTVQSRLLCLADPIYLKASRFRTTV